MRAARIFALGLLSVAVLATAAPTSADTAAYRKYVACGKSGKANPSHVCPVRRAASGNVGAFFRSNKKDVFYKVCVKFPGANAPRCANRQKAEQGKLYVNPITSDQEGRHKVTWFVAGKRVGVWFFNLR
jgi:hypothetical protein